MQARYGSQIELLSGGGVTKENVQRLMQETGISQIHGTFKTWKTDPTTAVEGLSYAYHENGDYEQTDEALLKEVVALVRGQEETK